MNERIDLDSEVIEELEQGRKIGAIKILRIKRSMGQVIIKLPAAIEITSLQQEIKQGV